MTDLDQDSIGLNKLLSRRPNRKERKRKKLERRGTYKLANQFMLDKMFDRVIASAASLAASLGVTTVEVLDAVGFEIPERKRKRS